MSRTHPVKESNVFAQPLIPLLIRSKKKSCTCDDLRLSPKGAPKYFYISPGLLIVHPMLDSHCGITGSARGTMKNLLKFSLARDAISYNLRMLWSFPKLSFVAGINTLTLIIHE